MKNRDSAGCLHHHDSEVVVPMTSHRTPVLTSAGAGAAHSTGERTLTRLQGAQGQQRTLPSDAPAAPAQELSRGQGLGQRDCRLLKEITAVLSLWVVTPTGVAYQISTLQFTAVAKLWL